MLVCVIKNEEWEIPQVDLDARFNYKIGVRHLSFRIAQNNLEDNQLLCLKSPVVDLSSKNSLQALEFFPYESSSRIQSHCPSSVNYQPLQLRNLQDASFDIIDPWSEHEILFSHFFLQLEILRIDGYGRIF